MKIYLSTNSFKQPISSSQNPDQARKNIVSSPAYKNFSRLQLVGDGQISFGGFFLASVKTACMAVGRAVEHIGEVKTATEQAIRDSQEIRESGLRTLEQIGNDTARKKRSVREKTVFFVRRKLGKLDAHGQRLKEEALRRAESSVAEKEAETTEIEAGVKILAKSLEQNNNRGVYQKRAQEIRDAQINCAKKTGLARIAGYREIQELFLQHVIELIEAEKRGEAVKIPNLLVFGPTGNGKTTLAKGLAEQTGCRLVKVSISNLPKEIRERKFMEKLTEEAKKAKQIPGRTVIFVDEIDKAINTDSSILPDFQEFLRTCSEKYNCTLLAVSNRPSKLGIDMKKDVNLFPVRISVDPPDRQNAAEVFERYLHNKISGDVDYNVLADELVRQGENRGGAYSNKQIEKICNASYEEITQKGKKLSQADVIEHLRRTEPRITGEELAEFKRDTDTFMREN
jgi:SpoVK/Ycf46/Vps4 family AAA+-type ATPase